jgi:hypothetical protein
MLISKNQKAKEYATTILNTTSDKLLLENSFLVVYTKLEKPGFGVRELVNTAIVILALSNLDWDNRLPLF